MVTQQPFVQIQLIDARKGGGEPDAARMVEKGIIDVVGLNDRIIICATKMMQFISCRVIDVETIVYRREDLPSVSQTHIVQVVAAVGDVAALNAQYFRSCDEGGLVSIIVSFWK